MKKILTTIALSLSALIATSAMADNHQRYENHKPYNSAQANKYNHYNDHNQSHDLRKGQSLPRQYANNSRFQVSDRDARRLPQHGKYQQWYKINGDYLLVNERNNKIIRILN